jgi:ketosteroid isomerase-like protein
MRKIIIGFALIFTSVFSSFGQTPSQNLPSEIQDKLALKKLVDDFSILADKKDIPNQMHLFTDDATVESVTNGQSSILKGKKEIANAFAGFLNLFEVVYHINGQQVVEINGNNATGTAYCRVTLIGSQNGVKTQRDMGVIYSDEYTKKDGVWHIRKRKSNFTWINVQPYN